MSLRPEACAVLHLAIETIVPALEPRAGDHEGLFKASVRTQNILPRLDEIVARQPADQLRELSWLLRLLEWPLFVWWLTGQAQRFSQLTQHDRERALLALSTSRVARLRKGFQAIKRLGCFLFYAGPADTAQAVCNGIGYGSGVLPAARAQTLPVRSSLRDLECDVCVVGSGAGGSVWAAELASAGKRVLVLEAAAPLQAADFGHNEEDALRSLYLQQGLLVTRDLSAIVVAGSALGGGTAVNWQTSLRTPDDVRAEWAARSGCSLFVEPGFTAALDAVCARLQVGTKESVVNANNDVLRRGCDALGYHWKPIPRNASGCDLEECGYCMFGCRVGGKQSTTQTYLRDALATGNATIVANCRVERIEHSNGRVTGVAARLGDRDVHVKADIVVAACGGIESPALLLRSGITLPALGRHLYLHPTTCVAGFFPDLIEPWRGAPQTVVCDEFAHLSQGYGFRLETAPAHPGLFALALPWRGARAHRELMQNFAHACAIIVLTRDHTGGRVTVDRSGRTRIDYAVGERERGYLARGVAAAARVLAAAGAERITTLHAQSLHWQKRENLDAYCAALQQAPLDRNWSPVLSAHQLGTCRMGTSRDSAVCGPDGEVFGVKGLYIGDGSALPGSSGVNPMITIMAVAYHAARALKR